MSALLRPLRMLGSQFPIATARSSNAVRWRRRHALEGLLVPRSDSTKAGKVG